MEFHILSPGQLAMEKGIHKIEKVGMPGRERERERKLNLIEKRRRNLNSSLAHSGAN